MAKENKRNCQLGEEAKCITEKSIYRIHISQRISLYIYKTHKCEPPENKQSSGYGDNLNVAHLGVEFAFAL